MRTKVLSTLRSVANAFLGRSGKPDRIDTATRMAMDADFSHRGEPSTFDELMRIVGEQDAKPSLRRAKTPTFSNRLRRTRGLR